MPGIIDLCGSTIQVTSAVTAATTSGTVGNGATSIPLQTGQGALFAVGDILSIHSSAYSGAAFASGILVTAVNGDTLTTSAVSYDSTTTTTSSGAFVQHDNACMYLQGTVSTLTGVVSVEIKNGIFDGNHTARIAAGLRQAWSCHAVLRCVALSLKLTGNTFKSAPCDAVLLASVPFFKATGNHIEDAWGNGLHIGGSTTITGDCIVTGNSFKNVTQLTAVTTPTIDQYQHTYQSGAIATSSGPFRTTVTSNVVDTATRWGFAAYDANDTQITLTGNVFSSCGAGGFSVATGGKQGSITGNMIVSCGRETADASSIGLEMTGIRGTNGGAQAGLITVSGNTFVNSVLAMSNDAADIAVTGNVFDGSNLVNTNGSTNVNLTAMIMMIASTSGCKRIAVTGNLINLPTNVATALNGIGFNTLSEAVIQGNTVTGGRHGIAFTGVQTNVAIAGNMLYGQSATSGGGNPRAIRAQYSTASFGNRIDGNHMVANVTNSTSWGAIDMFANGVTSGDLRVCNNEVRVSTRPTSGASGIMFNTTAITWSGFQISVNGNTIIMNNVSDAPIVPPATGATTVHILTNRMFGGSTPTLTGNTVAIGGGTDSNFYA